MNPEEHSDLSRPEPVGRVAPPVVASVVVYQPGSWFIETLQGLAAQTYPELQTLFLLVGGDAFCDQDLSTSITETIHSVLPNAVVRSVEGNPGFGTVCNEVGRLVEGNGGFFCLMHDDVALEPNAIENLIEEMFRSNAGLVGPKLVSWDDPTILQNVGLNVDRIGEVESLIAENEKDQEQHDSVRDVFALSSACILIRSDLFREIGGFNRDIEFFGEDLELCWRAHLSGARVLIVPTAKARHRSGFNERCSIPNQNSAQSRNRIRTVMTLSGALQLPFVVLQMLLVSLVQVVSGVFGGGFTSALSSLRATLRLFFDIPYVVRRRSEVRSLRRVSASEIHDLQVSGSARFSAFLRRRSARIQQTSLAQKDRKDAVKHQRFVTNIFLIVGIFVLVGSRNFFFNGLTHIGEFLPLRAGADSPRALFGSYFSGWVQGGFGIAGSNSMGVVLMALAGVVMFGQLGALLTVVAVSSVFVGAFGMWKLPAGYFSLRARAVGMAVYVAIPLPYVALSKGRLSELIVYATIPWVLRLFVRAESGLRGAKQTQLLASGVLLVAVSFTLVPSIAALIAWVAVVWMIGGLVAKVDLRHTLKILQVVIAMVFGSYVLNALWVSQFVDSDWAEIFIGSQNRLIDSFGLQDLSRFDGGLLRIGIIAIGLYVPVFISVIVTRSATFVWASRAISLVVLTGLLVVSVDADIVNIPTPQFGQLSVVIGCGLALGAAALASFVFDDDRAKSYRWWKPAVVVATLAALIGAIPSASLAVSGSWKQSEVAIADLYSQLQSNPPEGDYNTVFVGRREVLPLRGMRVNDAIAFAVADDGELTFRDTWSVQSDADRSVAHALKAVVEQETVRGGRLLAPLAVRYVVVPIIDGGESTFSSPLPSPDGLLAALSTQLDFRRVYQASDLVIYENTAWIPSLAVLDETTAELSNQAGDEVLLSSRLNSVVPILRDGEIGSQKTEIQFSTVHAAIPFSSNLELVVDGENVSPRIAFGGTTAFDVTKNGVAELRYRVPIVQRLFAVFQIALWLLVIMAVFDLGRLKRRIQHSRMAKAEVLHVG